ncbi:MAG: CPBP family intramembrane glutamic endopeptidase [Opitutales bacterium]
MRILERDNDLMLFGLDKSKSSQKGALAFIAIYVFATLFGVVLTPLLYWLTEYFSALYPENETFIYLLDKGVDKYFDRARYLGIVVGLPFIFKYCKLTSIKALGLGINKKVLSIFAKYFLLGFCVMAFIYTLQFIFTDTLFRDLSIGSLPKIFLTSALAAIILGFLEELIFRGLIFRCFCTAWGVLPAILFSSFFFAYKHFKVPDCAWEMLDLHTAHWYTGFSVAYYDSIGMFMDFSPVAFFSLSLLAMFLCVIYLKTKNLYAPIAFHVAVVFALQVHRKLFIVNKDDLRIFFGNSGAINSFLCLIILSILLIFSILSFKKRDELS